MANDPGAVLPLQVTRDATMLHTAECPHLGVEALAALVPASEAQLANLPVCSSCRDILDGGRRQWFPSFDAALEALPVPLENRTRMREVAAGLTYERIWIPASRSYIAVAGEPGSAAVAYFNKGAIHVHRPDGGYDRETLSTYTAGSGAEGARTGTSPLRLCPTCHTQLPMTGVCDVCDG